VSSRVLEAIPEGIRLAIRRRTPGWAWYRLQLATSYLEAPLDPTPLRRIESEPLDRLRDPEVLSEDLLPEMGLTSLHEELFPPRLRSRMGQGVQSIQFPSQLGPYLATVADAGVVSYLEVGVEHGGTFAITVEFLRRFGLRRALAVDLGPTPLLFRRWKRPEVSFAAMNSHSPAFAALLRDQGPFDLALIDGDHSEEGVRQDFETVRPHARMLALHDIVEEAHAGVGRVWSAIREEYADEYEFREFTAQYPELDWARLGIGLAIRRK
jgi:methyltransferase family protein